MRPQAACSKAALGRLQDHGDTLGRNLDEIKAGSRADRSCQPKDENTQRQCSKPGHAQGFRTGLRHQFHHAAGLIGKQRIKKALGDQCAAEDQKDHFKHDLSGLLSLHRRGGTNR